MWRRRGWRGQTHARAPSETGQILIWEHGNQESYHSYRHPRKLQVTGLAWHPKDNTLAWADDHGYVSVWNKPVNAAVKGFAAPVGGAGVAVRLPGGRRVAVRGG